MRLLNSVKRYVHSCTTDSISVTFILHYNMKLLTVIIGKEQSDGNKRVECSKRRLARLLFAKDICNVKPAAFHKFNTKQPQLCSRCC
jgi:hypothetical protein